MWLRTVPITPIEIASTSSTLVVMVDPARKDRSFEELYEEIRHLPEGLTGEILEPGVVRTMSRPGKRHRHAAGSCFLGLSGVAQNHGGNGWWIEQEAEIRFPTGKLAVPDLSGWRVERVPVLPDENPLTILPDWCCEILSPNTAKDDRRLKLPLYARSGVPWTWLVDPVLQLIEVYQTVNGWPALATTAGEDETRALPPFEVEMSFAGWWLPEGSEPGP